MRTWLLQSVQVVRTWCTADDGGTRGESDYRESVGHHNVLQDRGANFEEGAVAHGLIMSRDVSNLPRVRPFFHSCSREFSALLMQLTTDTHFPLSMFEDLNK